LRIELTDLKDLAIGIKKQSLISRFRRFGSNSYRRVGEFLFLLFHKPKPIAALIADPKVQIDEIWRKKHGNGVKAYCIAKCEIRGLESVTVYKGWHANYQPI
jgi:hypothetical protein